jgi:hypothetical protein
MIAAASTHRSNSTGAAAEPPSLIRPTGRLGDIDENRIFDVCIIGSGFAGAILGESLVRRGVKTVVLESGPDPRGTVDSRFSELEVFRTSGPIEYPVASTRFRGLGGTSWLWGGFCTRLHPIDFEKNSYIPGGAQWPITYADLEPYYDQAEKALRVRGGKPSEHEPPRKVDFPLPADRDLAPLQLLLKRVGIAISDVPFSTPVVRDSSILSGRYGPFLRMTEDHLPSFQASRYALFSEVTVTRLLVDERGYVRGAEVRNLDRDIKILRAPGLRGCLWRIGIPAFAAPFTLSRLSRRDWQSLWMGRPMLYGASEGCLYGSSQSWLEQFQLCSIDRFLVPVL